MPKPSIGGSLCLIATAICGVAAAVEARAETWQRRPEPVVRRGPAGAWDDLLVYAPRLLKRTDGSPYVDPAGHYYLFYTASGTPAGIDKDATGLVRSRDLFDWERASSAPVLPRGPAGSPDHADASAVTILEENGLFHMWFEGNDGSSARSDFVTINYATSADGIAWTKFAGNPIIRQGTGDDREDLYAPIVIKDGGVWKMWYTGHDDRGRYGLMHASAPAPAGPWTKHGSTYIFYPGDVFPSEVWRENGIYHMLYMRSDLDFREILLATSLDGVTWIHRGAVFAAAGGSAWDNASVRWPTQGAVGDTWFTFYHATNREEAIGVATSRDRYGFLAGGEGVPGPPLEPAVTVSGTDVRVAWSAPASGSAVDEYLVSAGPAFGGAQHGTFAVPGASRELAAAAPDGLYFVRVAARNGSGTGPPSHDIWFQVGPCDLPPEAPTDLTAAVSIEPNGLMSVRLAWQPVLAGCFASSWVVEIGTAPGAADVARLERPAASASFFGQGPPGPYHVRVRGRNRAGPGAATPSVPLVPRP